MCVVIIIFRHASTVIQFLSSWCWYFTEYSTTTDAWKDFVQRQTSFSNLYWKMPTSWRMFNQHHDTCMTNFMIMWMSYRISLFHTQNTLSTYLHLLKSIHWLVHYCNHWKQSSFVKTLLFNFNYNPLLPTLRFHKHTVQYGSPAC